MLDIEDFKKSIGNKSRLLGIDPGKKRIGLAISDEDKLVSTPLKTILKKKFFDLIKEIKEIIEENNIKGIVVGNPLNMDGSKGSSSQSSNDFARNLSNNISIPVTMWDERLSSEGAFKLSANTGVNTSKKIEKLDQNAASFILQGALDYLKR
ncbi:MAG: Holliday junction resolvase RuvX [Pelagibacteraceae bacterium]|jgi:putative Holliday junction resolvase|uniref:YqgF/RNase H-like domain-containing protein n=1 Tax=marine metagenome TaxID=408172 RepID=A0A381SKE0_9ZZZZ|nr:Holliday junction resolvase RuvX [Pelagibacteraceae bacterium]MBO6481882.1 Holliday junction resolvase RuvX [Pelagibacteraceae bacterium]MBO6483868.1 Holliday junction resolvase RuvX [Pelagibacteraceae bacterium]MBO6484551.1 Holliday junction resolvase RuvX [Pelagibacteraceae bacterium]MBO6485433.1 Holliday junction resolvase RuvX [Pelagibacteraceae bacterium]